MREFLYFFKSPAVESMVRQLRGTFHLVAAESDGSAKASWKTPALLIADAGRHSLESIKHCAPAEGDWRVIYVLSRALPSRDKDDEHIFALLPPKSPREMLRKTVANAMESLRVSSQRESAMRQFREMAARLGILNRIGIALTTERNTEALLDLILTKSREITGCDAGSLYLVEQKEDGEKRLVFKLTQNDSHAVPFRHFTLPIDTSSIAGYVAATGKNLNIKDAYRIRRHPFRLNREFDKRFGYRTKSLLVVPMKNQKGEIIGVVQLINAKKREGVTLSSPEAVREEVIPFSERSEELAASLASQAAVALENSILYRDIQRLFEGFVRASVTAIESRDPSTFGHSERVAKLTVGLAEAVDRANTGPYKDIRFTRDEMQELRYASLLHDFGKVGVREEVLVKAKKLYPMQLDLIERRFHYIKKVIELGAYRKKLDHVLREGNLNYSAAFAPIEEALARELKNLDEFYEQVLTANEPTVLPKKTAEKLAEIAGWTFQDPDGPSEPLLSPGEFHLLSIPKGSLDDEERLQIESHVIHSFRFLSQIPWTKELKRIPEIARAHHERLDGTGYPYHMKAAEIPFPTKMMTISDIFDALTARDRPYKRSLAVARALEIIGEEVKSQLLDPALFQIFMEARIYDLTTKDLRY